MTADAMTSETDEQTTETTTETAEPSNRSGDIERMESALRKANREAADLRRKLKEHEDAKLSETEKLQSRLTELERTSTDRQSKLQEVLVERAIERKAVRLGVIDPEVVVRLMDLSALEYKEDGTPKDGSVEKALNALIEQKPYLAGKRGPGSGDGGPRGAGAQPPSMNDWIRGVAAGR